jgi:type II secretory pathway pseudopilin PulG
VTILIVIGAIIIVLLIGGTLLSSIVLGSLEVARQKGRDARRVADVKQIQLGLELYFDQNNSYPSGLAPLSPEFLSALPSDPSTGSPYPYAACGPRVYHLAASLESSSLGVLADDADMTAVCASDSIRGADSMACDGSASGHCFDIYTDDSTSTATQIGNVPQNI